MNFMDLYGEIGQIADPTRSITFRTASPAIWRDAGMTVTEQLWLMQYPSKELAFAFCA
jgi:hypothetical protein